MGDQSPPLGDAGEELTESAESQSPHLVLAHVRESISVRLIPPGPVPGVEEPHQRRHVARKHAFRREAVTGARETAKVVDEAIGSLVWNPLTLIAPIPAPHPLASAAAPFAQPDARRGFRKGPGKGLPNAFRVDVRHHPSLGCAAGQPGCVSSGRAQWLASLVDGFIGTRPLRCRNCGLVSTARDSRRSRSRASAARARARPTPRSAPSRICGTELARQRDVSRRCLRPSHCGWKPWAFCYRDIHLIEGGGRW